MVLIGARPSEVNVSYVDYEDSIVATVDGQKVASLSHLPFLFSRAVVASASCLPCGVGFQPASRHLARDAVQLVTAQAIASPGTLLGLDEFARNL